jgi:Protein of unknown function (DUF1488)
MIEGMDIESAANEIGGNICLNIGEPSEQDRASARGGAMFFTFPEDARWNAERQAVEFGVVIGEYQGVVRVSRRVFQRLLPERPTPERCVEAYYLQRTGFEGVAERKVCERQLTEDGNVEITGRDLREGSSVTPRSTRMWRCTRGPVIRLAAAHF